jgi:two-component system invasion response regulator UvrY
MLNVMLASSIPLLREGMKGILSKHRDIAVVGEFSCAADICLRESYYEDEILVFAHPVDDLNEAVVSEMSLKFPPIKIIVIARREAMGRVIEGIRCGARGLISSDCDASCFPDAIRTVAEGKAYVSVDMLQMLTHEMKLAPFRKAHETLTNRELEIFSRLAAGKTNASISYDLDISSKTVSTYKMRLMEKLGLSTMSELVQYALEKGLIGIDDVYAGHAHHATG